MPALRSLWEDSRQATFSIAFDESPARGSGLSPTEEKVSVGLIHVCPKVTGVQALRNRQPQVAVFRKSDSVPLPRRCALQPTVERQTEEVVSAGQGEKRSSILRRRRSKSADLETRRPKAVLFSDTVGLPLVQVRSFDHILDTFERTDWSSDALCLSRPAALPFRFVGDQPSSCADFPKRLRQQRVCLESLRVSGERAIGSVQVLNVSFEKVVSLRLTCDGWRTFSDVAADFSGSLGADVDRFTFTLMLALQNALPRTGKIMFAIRYAVGGEEFWDNNYGSNYRILHGQ